MKYPALNRVLAEFPPLDFEGSEEKKSLATSEEKAHKAKDHLKKAKELIAGLAVSNKELKRADTELSIDELIHYLDRTY